MLLVASRYGNRDKLWPDGPLGSYTDFTLHTIIMSHDIFYHYSEFICDSEIKD